MRIGPRYRWKMGHYTPDTIPMTRLAEYMQQLGRLLGHDESVHFERIEKGSTAIVAKIDRGIAAGNVKARITSVKTGNGPNDAMRANQSINEMLDQDGTTATLKQGSATVIRFPGTKIDVENTIEIQDFGSVVGYLYMLSQNRSGFQARLRLDEGLILKCNLSSEMGKNLRKYLFEDVKVAGNGRWRRSDDGVWSVIELNIVDVTRIQRDSLKSVVNHLRNLDINWTEDPLGYLSDLNEKGNGIQ